MKFYELVKSRNFIVRLSLETGGRKGKAVTVVDGLPKTEAFLSDLLKTLKQKCGSGGTLRMDGKDGILELQGDHRERVRVFLEEHQIKVSLKK